MNDNKDVRARTSQRVWFGLVLLILIGIAAKLYAAADTPNNSCGNGDQFSCYRLGANTPSIENQNHWNVASAPAVAQANVVPTAGWVTPAAVMTPQATPGNRVNCCFQADSRNAASVWIGTAPLSGAIGTAAGMELQPGSGPICRAAIGGDCSVYKIAASTACSTAANLCAVYTLELVQ